MQIARELMADFLFLRKQLGALLAQVVDKLSVMQRDDRVVCQGYDHAELFLNKGTLTIAGDQHQVVRFRLARHLRKIVVAQGELLGVREVGGNVRLLILQFYRPGSPV